MRRIPRGSARPMVKTAKESSKSAPGRGLRRPRILVLEDDPLVSTVLGRVLVELGCSVERVSDGKKALAAWRKANSSGRPFAATILDLGIAHGMGGGETMKRLKDLDPKAKGIVSSGGSVDPVVTEYRKHGFSSALLKPYRLEDISAALREAIGWQ